MDGRLTGSARRELGRSGVDVSAVFYGAGTIGGIGSSAALLGHGLTAREGAEHLDRAVAHGIDVVDTADSYAAGASEDVVGRWAADHPGVLVTTKVGNPVGSLTAPDLSRGHITRQVARSRATLGRVDLYVTHTVDPRTPWRETVETLSGLVDAGTIRAYGCSNVTAADLRAVLDAARRSGVRRPEWVQNSFNLADRRDEADLLAVVRDEGLGYTPFSPLAGGLLSDRYLDERPPEPGSRIALAGGEYAYAGTPDALRRVAALRAVATELGVSTAGLALAWLVGHPDVTAPIVSPRTPAQWHAVEEAGRLRLDPDAHRRVGDLFR